MLPDEQTCYAALTARNPDYEGVFFVAVRTTGVFCRPTCPARPPKRENCEFFPDARAALLAAYRPCRRCRPLAHDRTSEVVRLLVDAIERARQALARCRPRRAAYARLDRAPAVPQTVRHDLRGSWRARRRYRRELARLLQSAPHLIDDIGLLRQHAEREAAKPFWRPKGGAARMAPGERAWTWWIVWRGPTRAWCTT